MNTQSISAAHATKAVSLTGGMGGTYRAECTGGWVGEKQYSTGARGRARSDGYDHEIDAEEVAGETK